MGIITVDFETYYDQEYSLRKLTTVEYLLSPRYQTILCQIKRDNNPTMPFVGHDAIAREFATIDWSKNAMLAHNTKFDGAIARWHFGVKPAMFLDTLSMARAMLSATIGSISLEALSKYLGLPPKGDEVHHMIGKRLEHFSTVELARYCDYGARDNENCRAIFDILRPRFPTGELDVIDMVLRMFIEPQSIFNPTKLAQHLQDTRIAVAGIMAKVAHLDKKQFTSNPQFAQLLENHGVMVPMKISKTTGELTWALAKGDRGFKELCSDETLPLEVQTFLAARIAAKSTIEETRTQRLLTQSQLRWPKSNLPIATVALKFSGAHTHRFSGDDKTNWQNFKRGSALRESIEAPPGMRIVHRDASQIEARFTAWLAGCTSLVDAFAAGRDIYSEFATRFYGRLVTKADKLGRFVGKTCLAGDTMVVTQYGLVPIRDITHEHLLWDGVEWVSHDGLLAQGQRETMKLSGVSLTPDHGVYCDDHTWVTAERLAREPNIRCQSLAFAAANSPLPDTFSGYATASRRSSCVVIAGGPNIPSIAPTFATSRARDATTAPRSRLPERDTGDTPKLCRMTATAPGFSTDWLPPSRDATVPTVEFTPPMEDEASPSTVHGTMTGLTSFAMCRHFQDGITPPSRWTGSTTTRATIPAISGLLPAVPTCGTSEASTTSQRASLNSNRSLRNCVPVYDIANAGPRHRFTIMTEAGPLIVSNCILGLGFGMGAPRFRHSLFIGQGGISMDMSEDEARQVVNFYREEYREIPLLWTRAVGLLHEILRSSGRAPISSIRRAHEPFPIVQPGLDSIWLPSGLAITYRDLRQEQHIDLSGRVETRWVYTGIWGEPVFLFGGKVVENVVQALARIVVTETMRRVRAKTRRRPMLSTHDSLDYVVPNDEAEAFSDYLEEEFSHRLPWCLDLPLASEGGWGATLAAAEDENHPRHNQ